MKKSRSVLVLFIAPALLVGCATTSFVGDKEQYAVTRDTGMFFGTLTPAITIIEERTTGKTQTFSGPSAFSQAAGVAGNVAVGAFVMEGLKGSGTRVNQTGGGANAAASATGGAGGKGGASSSTSSARVSSEVETNITNKVNASSTSSGGGYDR